MIAPTNARMSAESASDVSGPVATMTGDQPDDALGMAGTSSRAMVISGMRVECLSGDALRKHHAIDGERRAGRHPRRIGGAHDERPEPTHLFFEQADGVIELVAAERIAADQFREAVGLVHGGRRAPAASRES